MLTLSNTSAHFSLALNSRAEPLFFTAAVANELLFAFGFELGRSGLKFAPCCGPYEVLEANKRLLVMCRVCSKSQELDSKNLKPLSELEQWVLPLAAPLEAALLSTELERRCRGLLSMADLVDDQNTLTKLCTEVSGQLFGGEA